MKKFYIFVLSFLLSSAIVSFAQQTMSIDDLLRKEADAKNRIAKKLLENDPFDTPNMKLYDVTYYQLNLEMLPNVRQITGFVIMNARVLSSINFLELHKSYSLIVDSIKVDGLAATYGYTSPILRINLPNTKNAGEMVSAQIFYHGTPNSEGFGFNTKNGRPMIWSLSEPYAARTWWPCMDLPRDKADSADIIITVPKDLIVASNGSLREEKEISGGKKQFWWHEKYPISTYLISIAIHPYRVYYDEYTTLSGDTMPLHFYVFPENYNHNYPYYSQTKTMIHAYASLFGEYPFVEEKYGHAEFLGWASGMEHQTLTSLNGVGETLIAHELAHQWWGDMITCNTFHDIWLNEGFATYSEALWMEWSHGEEEYHNYQKSRFYYGAGTIYVEDPQNDDIFTYNLTYRKASCVLHMLRHVVGDSVFFEILHTYHDDPQRQYGTVTTSQFRQICENVSGMDLKDFFQQWIYEEGYPYYQYFYTTKKLANDRHYLFGTISQIQDFGPIFKMPVDITIETTSRDTSFVVWVNNQIDTFSVILQDEPLGMSLDKNDWILCKKEYASRPFFSVNSFEIIDSTSNNNGRWDAGETTQLKVSGINSGMPLENAKLILRVSHPQIAILDSTAAVGAIDYGQIFSNDNDLFTISADAGISGRLIPFSLLVYENNEFIGDVEFAVPVGKPSILLIDDDQENNYETYYQQALQASYNYFDYWNSHGKNYPDSLADFNTVIWFQDTQTNNLLTDKFQNVLAEFINNNGNLVIFSQNLAEFVYGSGDANKIAFLTNYLGVQFEGSVATESVIVGKSGDPITSGMAITFSGPYGIDNQHSRDEISPASGAVTIFSYLQSRKSAAIRFEPSGTSAKVVYLAFGLEGVAGPSGDTAGRLISNIFNWFYPLTSISEPAEVAQAPESFQLFQNYPNPFNPETHITYLLPIEAKISISIYNISGQHIRTLFSDMQKPGLHSILWDGKDKNGNLAASGIYIYRMKSGNFSQQKKMILIR